MFDSVSLLFKEEYFMLYMRHLLNIQIKNSLQKDILTLYINKKYLYGFDGF